MSSNAHPAFAPALKLVTAPTQLPAFYLIESRWKQQTFIHETDIAHADLDAVVKDVATGQYDTGEITAIYRCVPIARIMEDATQAVLHEVAAYLNRTETVPCELVARLLWQNGIGYAAHLRAAE